jgi:hypothetical protein
VQEWIDQGTDVRTKRQEDAKEARVAPGRQWGIFTVEFDKDNASYIAGYSRLRHVLELREARLDPNTKPHLDRGLQIWMVSSVRT